MEYHLEGGGGGGEGVKLIYLRVRPQVNKKVPKYTGLFGILWGGPQVNKGGEPLSYIFFHPFAFLMFFLIKSKGVGTLAFFLKMCNSIFMILFN